MHIYSTYSFYILSMAAFLIIIPPWQPPNLLLFILLPLTLSITFTLLFQIKKFFSYSPCPSHNYSLHTKHDHFSLLFSTHHSFISYTNNSTKSISQPRFIPAGSQTALFAQALISIISWVTYLLSI